MIPSPFTKLTLIFSALFSLLIIGLIGGSSIINKQTRVVFCNVGQGDATYIRIKNRVDLLIDAGADQKILSCLGKYMPFYDRKIELAIISHPQKDHFGGFVNIIQRYQIEKLLLPAIDSADRSFTTLKNELLNKKTAVILTQAGDQILINNAKLQFYWPTNSFLTKNLINDKPRQISGKKLGASSLDANYFSLIFMFERSHFRVLFPGDAPASILNKFTEKDKLKTTILKIPHHGSKNGLSKKFLQLADPSVAVISVGKNNPHGHPSAEVLEMLQAMKIKIKRTDEEGDIVFKINSNVK